MASPLLIPLLLGASVLIMKGRKRQGEKASATTEKADLAVLALRKKENPLYPFEDVAQLQEALIATGHKLPKYGADGKWGKETERALQAFSESGRRYAGAFEPRAVTGPAAEMHRLATAATKKPDRLFTSKDSGARLWCNFVTLEGCRPEYECIPLFEEGRAPVGWEEVGICIHKIWMQIGHIPRPQDYVPGGFNEVFHNPKKGSIHIGAGWELGTIHPFLKKHGCHGDLFHCFPTLRSLGRFIDKFKRYARGTRGKGAMDVYSEYMAPFRLSRDEIRDLLNKRKMALDGQYKLGPAERGIFICSDFREEIRDIYGNDAVQFGDDILFLARWAYARLASVELKVRDGKNMRKISDLPTAGLGYSSIMEKITSSMCKYQKLSME